MKLAVIILGAFLATALADLNGDQSQGSPVNDLLQNVDVGAMADMLNGVDIEGLMKNIDPATITGLLDNLKSGDILNNMGSMTDLVKNIDMGAMGKIIQDMDKGALTNMIKSMDLGPMGDVLKHVDIEGIMNNMDMSSMGNILKNTDIDSIVQNLGPIGSIVKNVDVQSMMKGMNMGGAGGMGDMMKNMDLGSIGGLLKNVDIAGIMQNMDMGPMGDILKNIDLGSMGGMLQNMDLGAMGDIMKNMDLGSMGDIMKNMDLGAIGSMMKNVDVAGLMQNMDLGPISGILKNVDIGSVMNIAKNIDIPSLMKGQLPSMDAIKNIFGIPEDASKEEIKLIILEKLENAGVPLDHPMKLLEYLSEKLEKLPLPEGMNPATMLNMIHGQLEAMGIPEDPSKLQEFVFEKIGLEDIKDIGDLKDPEIIAKILQKKALKMLGLDENEDPAAVTDRIKKQLLEEAKKLGASLPDDFTQEQVIEEMDKVLTKEVNEWMGLNSKSVMPSDLKDAVMEKMAGMGFPLNDFSTMKKNVIKMAMKHLMKSGLPMLKNLIFPPKQPQMPPQMPPHMMPPHMMPPRMPMMPPMQGPTIPINLDIEVNVDQPPMMAPQMPMIMPRYLHGMESALHHPGLDRLDDGRVYQHIMAVRQALRYGEMPEEALQELVEDLMNARLKARVLSVRNMFLRDRLAAMEQDVEMMPAPEVVPMRSQNQEPILMRLLRPRVN